MPQTFLALAALVAFTFFAYGQYENHASLDRRTYGADIERALTEAARNRLTEIARLAFDEEDIGGRAGIRLQPPTSPIGRDDGEDRVSAFDDVDDFNDLVAVNGGPERRVVSLNGTDVAFDLTVSARYVNPANPLAASSAPTLAKEIVVTAQEVTTGRTGRPPVRARFSRVLSPASQATR